jgi:hypothetical protein
MRGSAVLGVIVLAIAFAGCGSSSSGSSPKTVDTVAQQKAAAKRKAVATYNTCKNQIGGLIKEESKLSSRLDIGLNYDEYTSAVGNVKAVYDQVPFKQLSPDCLTAGIPAETALNAYAKAATIWNTCFDDVNCNNDQIQPDLQKQWSKASRLADSAKSTLESLKTPSS